MHLNRRALALGGKRWHTSGSTHPSRALPGPAAVLPEVWEDASRPGSPGRDPALGSKGGTAAAAPLWPRRSGHARRGTAGRRAAAGRWRPPLPCAGLGATLPAAAAGAAGPGCRRLPSGWRAAGMRSAPGRPGAHCLCPPRLGWSRLRTAGPQVEGAGNRLVSGHNGQRLDELRICPSRAEALVAIPGQTSASLASEFGLRSCRVPLMEPLKMFCFLHFKNVPWKKPKFPGSTSAP